MQWFLGGLVLSRRGVFNVEVKVGDCIILQVTRFKYLGSVVQNDGVMEGDVNYRIEAGLFAMEEGIGCFM